MEPSSEFSHNKTYLRSKRLRGHNVNQTHQFTDHTHTHTHRDIPQPCICLLTNSWPKEVDSVLGHFNVLKCIWYKVLISSFSDLFRAICHTNKKCTILYSCDSFHIAWCIYDIHQIWSTYYTSICKKRMCIHIQQIWGSFSRNKCMHTRITEFEYMYSLYTHRAHMFYCQFDPLFATRNIILNKSFDRMDTATVTHGWRW